MQGAEKQRRKTGRLRTERGVESVGLVELVKLVGGINKSLSPPEPDEILLDIASCNGLI